MKILSIIYYTALRNFRDYKSLSSMLLFPIILILILGSALKTNYEPPKLDRMPVAYINKDAGEISKHFTEYINQEEIGKILEVKKISSLDEANKLLDSRDVRGIVFIDEDYSKKIISGEKAEIKVFTRSNGNLKSAILQNIVDGFVAGANTTQAIMKNINQPVNIKGYESILSKPITVEGSVPRAIDYYAVTMLVMTLMYGAIYACHGVAEDIFENIGKRISVSPVKLYENIGGKTIGTLLSVFLQGIVVILFTKYVYKTNWGNNMLLIILIAFSLAVLSTSIGIAACMITGEARKGQGLVDILVPLMTFFSGGYAKLPVSESFDRLRYFVPNQLGHNAFFNAVYGGSGTSIQNAILGMWLLSFILFGISIFSGRRFRR